MKFSPLLLGFMALHGPMPAAENIRPNIILMLSDDQDWNGLSVAMHPEMANSKSDFHRTPNLEKFAAQGMRFSSAYASAPVCSPTRISLQTGMNPARLRWTKAAPPETGHRLIEAASRKAIRADEITIGEVLKAAGYATAHYGKWHLSGGGPEKHGYDESDGDTGNHDADRFVDPNPVDNWTEPPAEHTGAGAHEGNSVPAPAGHLSSAEEPRHILLALPRDVASVRACTCHIPSNLIPTTSKPANGTAGCARFTGWPERVGKH